MGSFDSTNDNVMNGDSVKKPRVQTPQSATATSAPQVPQTVLIGGIPHMNINSTGGNPLSMAVDAYAQQAKFLAPSPFENRANERLAQNRAELGGDAGVFSDPKIAAPKASVAQPQGNAQPAQSVQSNLANPLAENQFNHMVNNNLRSLEDKGVGIVRQVGANGKTEFTNVGTAGITDPSKTLPQANSIDMNASNASMARANEIRQQMIDSAASENGIAGSGLFHLGTDVAKDNEEKTQRWRQDSLIAMAQRNPAAGALAAELARGNSGRDIEAMRQSGISEGHKVQMRGQDMAAQTAANHLAGNPLDNMLKSAQVETANYSVEKARQHNEIVAKLSSETDPKKRQSMIESLLASQGKNPAENRFQKVDGGEYIGPDGFTKMKSPSGMFDTHTQTFIPMDQQSQPGNGAQKFSSPADVAAAKAAGKLKSGDVIETPNGLMKVS